MILKACFLNHYDYLSEISTIKANNNFDYFLNKNELNLYYVFGMMTKACFHIIEIDLKLLMKTRGNFGNVLDKNKFRSNNVFGMMLNHCAFF